MEIKSRFKIGDKVWFITPLCKAMEGVVVEIECRQIGYKVADTDEYRLLSQDLFYFIQSKSSSVPQKIMCPMVHKTKEDLINSL